MKSVILAGGLGTRLRPLTYTLPKPLVLLGNQSLIHVTAAKLVRAGFDGLIVQGAARKPVHIVIRDGKAEIRDAAHLWGKDTHQTEDALAAELDNPETSTLGIGPSKKRPSYRSGTAFSAVLSYSASCT